MNKKHPWLMAAKKYLADNPDFKLENFVAIGYDDFHKEPGRGMNYAMSQALSYFLMHYDDQRYREDFVRLIAAHYAGKTKDGALYEFIQVPGPEADRKKTLETQFKEFMSKLGDD
jgi:hypothetical protein